MLKFTQHAKRRMRLYKITESEIEEVINSGIKSAFDTDKDEFIHQIRNRKLPLKIVCKRIEKDYLIITCYPLKKGN